MQQCFFRQRFTWVFLCILALGALLPLVSQATRVVTSQAGWIEVCSSAGMVSLQAPHISTDDNSSPLDGVQHCSVCTPSQSYLGAFPCDAPIAVVAVFFQTPAHPLQQPPIATVWLSARPRAPPALG